MNKELKEIRWKIVQLMMNIERVDIDDSMQVEDFLRGHLLNELSEILSNLTYVNGYLEGEE